LYIRRGTRIGPMIHGGHHESRRRGGTENVPGIVGFGKACELAMARFEEDNRRIAKLRDFLQAEIQARISGVHVNAQAAARLPGTLSVSFEKAEGNAIVMGLDIQGVAVSTGAACSSESRDPSPVLTAMGYSPQLALGTIRLSVGRTNTQDEMEQTVAKLAEIVARLRPAASLRSETA
jgi:cysteine desulfurase